MKKLIVVGALALFSATAMSQEVVGSVSTTFKLLGANDKIVIEAFDDPKVDNVTCFLSNAQTGGIAGSLGIAEDPSDASIACRAVGNGSARINQSFKNGEDVFTQSRSPLFKRLHITRFYDQKRNAVIYLTYSDKLIDGSPKNSISAVALGGK